MTKKQNNKPTKIKKAYKPKPQFDSEKAEIKHTLDIAQALDIVAASEGGQVLQSSLVSDIVSLVNALAMRYKTATHAELVSLCADMKSKVDILRVLSRAKASVDVLRNELEDALKE